MLQYKNEVLRISGHYRDAFWLENSLYFDWFLLFATVILMFIQFTMIITSKIDIETIKSDEGISKPPF